MTSVNLNEVMNQLSTEFSDWHVTKQKDVWPKSSANLQLSDGQINIVKRNVDLLINAEKWMSKIECFLSILNKVDNENQQKIIEEYEIHFDGFVFESGDYDFDGYQFPCSAIFKNVIFKNGNLHFNNASFMGKLCSFVATRVEGGGVYFPGSVFRADSVSFVSAEFSQGTVSFNGAKFESKNVYFSGASLGNEDVLFENVDFRDCMVNFQSVILGHRYVSFNCANFNSGSLSFGGAIIKSGNLLLTKIFFGGAVLSLDDIDLGETYLSLEDATISGDLIINTNTYIKAPCFLRLSVDGSADFSNSVFHEVPNFTDSKYDRAPDVSGIEILAFKKNWIWPWWKAGKDEGAKFRKLKAMALAANDHEKDGEFFAYEMLAKRGFEAGNTGPVALFINWLYFTFSNFGQSYVRPAIALCLNFFIFFVINALTAASYLKPADLSSFAFWQSFKNMIPFLNSLIRFASRPVEYISTYETAFNQLQAKRAPVEFFINAGIVQNFVGLILLFLLLLGLRNKFRLK